MSYPKDLEDYSIDDINRELERRRVMHEEGKCSYCARPLNSTPPCGQPLRHSGRKL